MGQAPPKNAASPGDQAGVDADAGFAPSPTGPSLCGFGLPGFNFNVAFRLPGFPPFGFPPTFNFFLGLKCDLSEPLSAQFGFGGGRVSQADADADPNTTADL